VVDDAGTQGFEARDGNAAAAAAAVTTTAAAACVNITHTENINESARHTQPMQPRPDLHPTLTQRLRHVHNSHKRRSIQLICARKQMTNVSEKPPGTQIGGVARVQQRLQNRKSGTHHCNRNNDPPAPIITQLIHVQLPQYLAAAQLHHVAAVVVAAAAGGSEGGAGGLGQVGGCGTESRQPEEERLGLVLHFCSA